jgi:hypothetical protein
VVYEDKAPKTGFILLFLGLLRRSSAHDDNNPRADKPEHRADPPMGQDSKKKDK